MVQTNRILRNISKVNHCNQRSGQWPGLEMWWWRVMGGGRPHAAQDLSISGPRVLALIQSPGDTYQLPTYSDLDWTLHIKYKLTLTFPTYFESIKYYSNRQLCSNIFIRLDICLEKNKLCDVVKQNTQYYSNTPMTHISAWEGVPPQVSTDSWSLTWR